jgi:hypothetical protein
MNRLSTPVLVLNANWQAIDVVCAQRAMAMIYSEHAIPLRTDRERLEPIKWKEWSKLNPTEEDDFIQTLHGNILIPRVVITNRYKKLRKTRIGLNNRNLARSSNYRCAYTGQHVPFEEGSLDHVLPQSRGGKTEWSNAAWTSKKLNNKKADKTPEEAGLTLQKPLPKKENFEILPSQKIKMEHGIRFKAWSPFLP